jgi:hypothetical protein
MLFFLACRENVNTEQETIHEIGTLCNRGLNIPNAELQFPEPAQDGIVHFGETRGTQIAQLLHEQLTNTALYRQGNPFFYGFKSLSEMVCINVCIKNLRWMNFSPISDFQFNKCRQPV